MQPEENLENRQGLKGTAGKFVDGLRGRVRSRAVLAISAVIAATGAAQAAPTQTVVQSTQTTPAQPKPPRKKKPERAVDSMFFIPDAKKYGDKGRLITGNNLDAVIDTDPCKRCVIQVRCPNAVVANKVPFDKFDDLGGMIEIAVPKVRGQILAVKCADDATARLLRVPQFADLGESLQLTLDEPQPEVKQPSVAEVRGLADKLEELTINAPDATPPPIPPLPVAPVVAKTPVEESQPWHVGITQKLAVAELNEPLLTDSDRALYGINIGRNLGADGKIAVEGDVAVGFASQKISENARFRPAGLRMVDGRVFSAGLGLAYRRLVAQADNGAQLRVRGGVRAGAMMLDFPGRPNAAVDGDGVLADLPAYRHVVPTGQACVGAEIGASWSRLGVVVEACGSSSVLPVQTTAGGPTERLTDAHAEVDFRVHL